MIIEVTQEDIDAADANVRPRSRNCPVARAMSRAAGEPWSVGRQGAYTLSEKHSVVLPSDVAEFVARFDEGKTIAPFSFEIDTPEEAPLV